jgi:hypothetical protein
VISPHEMAGIIQNVNFSVDQFILRSIYYSVAIYYRYECSIPANSGRASISHTEVRGCLFDKAPFKEDIIYSMLSPKICASCESEIQKHQIPKEFMKNIRRELRSIRRPLYFRVKGWIERHPIYSIVIATIASFVINIISNLLSNVLFPDK